MEHYVGEIRMFAGTFAPEGWHFCDGSLQEISDYNALCSLLGTTYGGDGNKTFGLPDLRGRAPVHVGGGKESGGTGIQKIKIGQLGGAEKVSLVTENLPGHTHVLNGTSTVSTGTSPSGGLMAITPKVEYAANAVPPSVSLPGPRAMNPKSIAGVGSGQQVSIIQPSIAINYIIAMTGNYPPKKE